MIIKENNSEERIYTPEEIKEAAQKIRDYFDFKVSKYDFADEYDEYFAQYLNDWISYYHTLSDGNGEVLELLDKFWEKAEDEDVQEHKDEIWELVLDELYDELFDRALDDEIEADARARDDADERAYDEWRERLQYNED